MIESQENFVCFPVTRREFTLAGTAVAAVTLLGCDGQADPGPSGANQPPQPAASKPKKSTKANLATEPFRIGPPSRYAKPGVYPGYKEDKGIWIVSDGQALVVLSATCTHLACTTHLDLENQWFNCPCHKSRFDFEGINQDGSKARRPLERCALKRVTVDGQDQIEVDPTRRFRKDRDEWSHPDATLRLG